MFGTMPAIRGRRRWSAALLLSLLSVWWLVSPAAAGSPPPLPQADPGPARPLTVAGAAPLATDRTIPYWHGQFTDPTNGITYGYNMVGADPATLSDTTIAVDIIPVDFVFSQYGNYSLKGSDIVGNVVASPLFQANDYTTTPVVSGAASAGRVPVVAGGDLSAGNSAVQYEDAIMRSQFDKTGTTYHVRLAPTVRPAVTVTVQSNRGFLYRNSRGVVWGAAQVDHVWLTTMAMAQLDPTHLWIFLTNNVFYGGAGPFGCCALGFHGATRQDGAAVGKDTSGQGQQPLATWMYAAYTQPGTFDPASAPFNGDIEVLTHEIAEWADDPFASNDVNPWSVAESPLYGCVPLLEVGDPVVHVGFALPGNTYDAGAYADGYWHLEDEVFLPWFARESPNVTSQLSQSGIGRRYTFMGDLNPYADFHVPARGC